MKQHLSAVLVVEDDQDANRLVCDMIIALGYDVYSAATAEDALGLLRQKSFSCLVADISLPGMSGIELAQIATDMHPWLHVVFASGNAYLVADKTDFRFALLPKPYNLSQLRLAMEDYHVDAETFPSASTPIRRTH